MLVNVIYGKGHSYQVVMSLISSHTRKLTVDMFSQREFLIKIFWLLVFDSYNFRSSLVEVVGLLSKLQVHQTIDVDINLDEINFSLKRENIFK